MSHEWKEFSPGYIEPTTKGRLWQCIRCHAVSVQYSVPTPDDLIETFVNDAHGLVEVHLTCDERIIAEVLGE